MYWRMSTHLLPAHTNTSVRANSEIQILPATCYHLEYLQPSWNRIRAINPKYLSLLRISLISINNSDMSTASWCETTASSLVQSDMGCLPRYFSSFSTLAKSVTKQFCYFMNQSSPFFPFSPLKVFIPQLSIKVPPICPTSSERQQIATPMNSKHRVHASPCWCVDTHSAGREFRRVVIHICHCNDRCGRVWETIVKISFHICCLNNDDVLLNFLGKKKKKERRKGKDEKQKRIL